MNIRCSVLNLAAVLAGFFSWTAGAQELTEAQKAAAAAALAMTEAPAAEQKEEAPKYWNESLKTNIKFGQTSLTSWAAGGDNTVSLQAYIDGNSNYKKNDLFWNNRLQLDYGFVYASSKPILQKSDDRIYFESKFGYKSSAMKNFSFSANFDFKSQFTTGYEYKTPGNLKDESGNDLKGGDLRQAWRDARNMKSNFLAPAYTNLAFGIDLKPWKWLSLNFAPLTGGIVIVKDVELRKNYGMDLKDSYKDVSSLSPQSQEKYNEDIASGDPARIGQYYRGTRFEFGAQIKADMAVKVNDNFAYTSQIVLFSNYLNHPENLRVNWDNRFDWKIAKYFSLTLTTNMIYDDKVLIFSEKDGLTKQRVQFKESVLFGFVYTIARQR